MNRCLALGVTLLLAAVSRSDDGIPAKTLAEIKAATVFIKMETVRTSGSGSGFVIRADKDGVLVVTNHHVITSGNVNNGPVRKLDVVFRSGKVKEETVYPAEVLASDADRDLAVLRVKRVADAPKPLDLSAKVELSETMTVYAVGFPFGEALATTDGNPATTISKSSVSSLREDDQGELAVVQLEGGINPGNSGGPVVDGKGRLVGVAVAKVRGTNIGLAIPPQELTRMLHGRIGGSSARVLSVDKDTAEVELGLTFIDPLEKVTTATIRVVKTDDPAPKPKKSGDIPELTGGTTHEVKLAGQKGTVRVKLPVARHQMQVTYSNEGRKNIRTGPIVHDLPTLARSFSVTTGGGRPGTPSVPDPRPTPNLPKPVNPLPSGPTKVGALTVDSVEVSAEGNDPQPGQRAAVVSPCLTWAADGKAFYALDHGGEAIRRYSYPGLKEEAKLSVGKDVTWLSLSKEGVVLTVAGEQEAWVLDPKTLKKGTSFPVNKATRVLSATTLSVGYVFDTGDGPFGGGTLRVVDLKTGKKLKEYQSKDLGKDVGLNTPVISADGKHLLTTGGIETLQQFALDGEKVTLVTASPRLVQGAFQQPVISADGKLACAPSGGGNYRIKGTDEGYYSTVVFATGNLTTPLLQLKTGAYPSTVGFDTKAGLIYAQNAEDQFIVLDSEGSKLKSHKLGKDKFGFKSVLQILPHPDGWRALVLLTEKPFGFGATVYSIEIPKK